MMITNIFLLSTKQPIKSKCWIHTLRLDKITRTMQKMFSPLQNLIPTTIIYSKPPSIPTWIPRLVKGVLLSLIFYTTIHCNKKMKDIVLALTNFRAFYNSSAMHTKQMFKEREALLHLHYKDEMISPSPTMLPNYSIILIR